MEAKPRFTAKDFSDFKYNVVGLTERQVVLEKFPELKKYPEFNPKLPALNHIKLAHDKMVRYALLMYSDNVIHRLIPEFAHRKREAALLAGFTLEENGRFWEPVENMLYCKYDTVNDMAVRVASLTRSTVFSRLMSYNDAIITQQKELNSSKRDKKDDKTKDIIANIERLASLIKDLESELLSGDLNKDLLERLYSHIEGISLGIRPEEIALARKQGKLNEILKETK